MTATGSYMRNVACDVEAAVGIVEIDAFRWRLPRALGHARGGRPTSEFAGHVLIHAARARATDGAARVLYHAHPTPIVALTKILPLDARTVTRTLWRAMTECVMVFPEGVGVVGFEVPGRSICARVGAGDGGLLGGYLGPSRASVRRRELRRHVRKDARHCESRGDLRDRALDGGRIGMIFPTMLPTTICVPSRGAWGLP